MFRIVKVTGQSLAPEIQDGDFVLVTKIPIFFHRLKAGDIIVFDHAIYGRMIKKIESIQAGGEEIFVVGSHQLSIDSRSFGMISRRVLIGKVIGRIRNPEWI